MLVDQLCDGAFHRNDVNVEKIDGGLVADAVHQKTDLAPVPRTAEID